MISLLEATIAFEKILPTCSYAIIDTGIKEYGELHRVYYDECNLSQEDPKLLDVVKPFITRTRMTPTHYDPEVENLREYLCPGFIQEKYEHDAIESNGTVLWADLFNKRK